MACGDSYPRAIHHRRGGRVSDNFTNMSIEIKDSVYSTRYVAFLDILGFSEIVRQSVTSSDQAGKLIGLLENIANASTQYGDVTVLQKDDFRAQSFSDCIVLSENASPVGLFHLLGAVNALSLDLLENGIFTRGGIAKGMLHHSDKVVFGPAMLDAYRIESTIARYPRILVDKATHLDYQQPHFSTIKGKNGLSPRLAFDTDGPPFLDILHLVRRADPDMEEKIASCRVEIQKALDASVYEPKHFEKLRWLTIYWNGVALDRGAALVNFPQVNDLNSIP